VRWRVEWRREGDEGTRGRGRDAYPFQSIDLSVPLTPSPPSSPARSSNDTKLKSLLLMSEGRRKSRFDVPPADSLTSQSAATEFLLKYGLASVPILQFSSVQQTVSPSITVSDPQEAIFRQKLKTGLQKNLDYIRRSFICSDREVKTFFTGKTRSWRRLPLSCLPLQLQRNRE
jgi:hypothetical protein